MSFNSYDLKQYIIQNNKVEFILEKMGCHSISEHKKDYRCALPNDINKTRVSIYKDSLSIRIFRSSDSTLKGDIFILYMEIFNVSFPTASKELHKMLGLTYNFKHKIKEKKIDPLDVFKRVKVKKRFNTNDIPIYNEDMIDDFIQIPHILWIREGIMPHTCKVFNIGYSPKYKRIIIPHRYWCGSDREYIGYNSRTVLEHYEMLDIPKYFIKPNMPKELNIYGLQENYKYIQEVGRVVIFESEKSVLRRHSLGDRTCVAISGHDVSDEQIKILISLNVEIVFAMDKDIKIEHVIKMCNKFKNIRKTTYIFDTFDLLKEKDSPADARDKVYKFLLNRRIAP